MKTLSKFLVGIFLLASIYFATIGRKEFYYLLDTAEAFVQVFAANYLKK